MKYSIRISGYGSEITIGAVSEEEKAILSNPEKDLQELVFEDLEEVCGWSEIDDQFHCFGATSPFTITIEDENGNELYELDEENIYNYDTEEFSLVENEYPEIDATKDLLICYSGEKGSFFLGYVELEGEFDITKLKIVFSDVEVGDFFYFGDIISNVLYDGEELDNWGGDTSGKSFDVLKNF
jgi:hypothetical protein